MTALVFTAQATAQELLGQPTPGAIDLQRSGSALRDEASNFHNYVLLPTITLITLFVLGLLVWIVVRYNKKANPVPARWSHNTMIEVIWTILPVLILMVIAIFSFRLLSDYHRMPTPDVTVKATGNQWYWAYEYPDQQIPEYTSNMLPEDEAEAKGVPYRLAATAPMVVPVNATVRVLTTGADVIHAFGVPAFGVIIDSIPGRVNETWFKPREVGTYYGQCRELCGVDHAFMPIEIQVVSQADFDAWTVSKGGKTKAMVAAEEAAQAVADAAAQAAADAAAAQAAATAPATDAAATAPAATVGAAPASGGPAGPAASAPAPKAGATPAPAAK